MEISIQEYILAIISTDKRKVQGGGCPVFYADSGEEQEKTSLILARILGGIVHDLENGVYIICKH